LADESKQVDARTASGYLAALLVAVSLIGGGFAVFNGSPWMPKAQTEREIAQLEAAVRQLRFDMADAVRRLEEHNRSQDAVSERLRDRDEELRERIRVLEHRVVGPRTYDSRR
jgi:hypothetical protein